MAEDQNARPAELQKKLAALIALFGAEFGRDPRRNQELIDDLWPQVVAAIASLSAWIAYEWSVPEPDTSEQLGRFRGAVLGHLDEHRDLSGTRAERYAETVAQSELRNVEVDLVQRAVRGSHADLVERRLGFSKSGPCPRCRELEGVHPIDFEDLYWEHPDGVCSWHPVAGGSVSGFAERFAANLGFAKRANRGNPQALRDWYNDAARSHINWGQPGDFARCVEIAGKYINNPQGYCNERHQDATGAAPGHAASEQKAKLAKRSKESVGFESPAKGPHHCGECIHFQSPNACALVEGDVDADDWCRLWKARVATMANWDSQEKRDKAPASVFCGPGKSFPVDDCEDGVHARELLHHAAAGSQSAISACVERKMRSMNCPTAGSQDKGKANHAMTQPAFGEHIAAFAAPAAFAPAGAARVLDADGYVVRKGKIFGPGTLRPGNFNHDITVTREHTALIAENAANKRIDISLGHPTSNHPLKGRMGYAYVSEVDDNGDIMGESHMPVWLEDEIDAAMGSEPVGVSVELDLDDLDLKGVTLAIGQIVPDAQLSAAFAKSQGITPAAAFAAHTTPIGQKRIQKIHDQAVKGGAVCRKPANMASRSEANAIQQIHDTAADNGAYCEANDLLAGGGTKGWNFHPTAPARAIHGSGRFAKGGLMGLGKFFKRREVIEAAAAEGLDPEELRAQFAQGEATPPGTAGAAAVINNGRLEAIEKTLAAREAEITKREAANFAAEEIKACRSMPADEEGLIAAYLERAAEDSLNPIAKFAADGATPQKSRLERFIEREQARQPILLSAQMLPDTNDGPAAAAAFANALETKGRLDAAGKPFTADLAEKDPVAFRNSERYRFLMAAAGDMEHEEPSAMALFGQVIEESVARGMARGK